MKEILYIGASLLLGISGPCHSQDKPDHVCPRFWWTGMKDPRLQILFHGQGMGIDSVHLVYPDVQLEGIHRLSNPHYLFVDLRIGPRARPGILQFHFSRPGIPSFTYAYSLFLKNPEDGISRVRGINSSDFIYLLVPDRFSDADTSNDRIAGLRDSSLDRSNQDARHGGDLEGITDHLAYLKDLGITAIWPTPVIENDQPRDSYHGYAFTDHFQVDPRLGGNRAYLDLVRAAHKKGMKVIQDIVFNHVGDHHWFVLDPPMKDWLNQWPEYTNTSYRESPAMDNHASRIDEQVLHNGWFVPSMPDLNQRNPYLARYLIQNALWWVEYAGIDGFRIDSYFYSDPAFMNRCIRDLLGQFPTLGLFGETWVHGVLNQAFFTKNNLEIPYKSLLPGVCDFQLNFALIKAMTQRESWTGGINALYLTTAKDFVYLDPMKNVVFLDNHDMSRIYSVLGGSFSKWRMAFAWLLTTRGIPQMYYGDEILMKGIADPSQKVRQDFPGGWSSDPVNKFLAGDRSDSENLAFNYIRTLARFRQRSPALKYGKLMHYIPQYGVYVYFRYYRRQSVMVLLNAGDRECLLATKRFSQRLSGFKRALDVVTGRIYPDLDSLPVPAQSALVLKLIKGHQHGISR